MNRKVLVALFLAACGVVISLGVTAQDAMQPAIYFTKAQITAGIAASNWGIGGQTFSIVAAEPSTLADSVGFRHREQGRDNDASVHSSGTDKVNATEVMAVVEGGGTFITDGEYVDKNPDYTKKDRAKGITGGRSRHVEVGDVVVIPPGHSHWFSKVDGKVTMIEARIPGGSGDVKDYSKDEIAKGIAASNWSIGGQTFSIIPADPTTKANSVGFRHREQGRDNDASVHSAGTDKVDATEVMAVVEGGGTFETGGTYVDKNPEYTKKDRAKGITGGVSHEVQVGDVVVIPPGTSHWFSKVNGKVTMIEVRLPGNATGRMKK